MKEKVKKAFDRIASDWDERVAEPRPFAAHFYPVIKKGWAVLDAGCGNAATTLEIAKRCRAVVGADFSKGMLERARRRTKAVKNVELVEADFTSLPFGNESFDAVFCIAALHHLTKREQPKAVKEFWRVLKKNGLVFVTVWSKNREKKRFYCVEKNACLVGWNTRGGRKVKRFYYFFDGKELGKLFKLAGFKQVKVFFERKGVKTTPDKARNICLTAFKKG